MATAGTCEIALELGRRRVRAVHATWTQGQLRVRRTMVETHPADLDMTDPEAVGRWIGDGLDRTGLSRGGTIVALSRERVVFKRLTLPTRDPVELPAMARLATQRELPFDPDQAVIDFVPVEHDDTSTTIIVVAVPRAEIDFARRLCKAAGLKVQRVSLRGIGAVALLDRHEASSRMLCLDVSDDGVECNVVEHGAIRLSRAADLPAVVEGSDPAEDVVREIRRTWMSFRIVDENSRIDEAVLFGEGDITAKAAPTIESVLNVPTRQFETHLDVRADETTDGFWPLIGLLYASHRRPDTIDLLNPRQAPDVRARRRQFTLGAVGVVLVALIAAWTFGRNSLTKLERRLDALQQQSRQLQPEYRRYARDRYKLEHLARWDAIEADWLAHAREMARLSPPPDRLVLDDWTGSLSFRGVQFDHRENLWSTPHSISIVLEGEAIDRPAADALRAALVDSAQYVVSATGSESAGGKRLPVGFTYRLDATDGTPAPTDATATPRSVASGGGGQ